MQGESLVGELRQIIVDGLPAAFENLVALRQLESFKTRTRSESSAEGVVAMQQLLTESLNKWGIDSYRRSMGALLCFDKAGRHNRALNGARGLRQQAAVPFNVGFDRFKREWEPKVIAAFAEWLLLCDQQSDGPSSSAHVDHSPTIISWDEVERVTHRIYRDVERSFHPDLIITMSGPGSFAACYYMKLNARDAPVLMCVTFPRHESPNYTESDFLRAAKAAGWRVFQTARWTVYVPNVLTHYPSGSRILLLDDRIVSGQTQQHMRIMLEEEGFDVRCGALFAPPKQRERLDFIGRIVSGDFEMPWGSNHGRS